MVAEEGEAEVGVVGEVRWGRGGGREGARARQMVEEKIRRKRS